MTRWLIMAMICAGCESALPGGAGDLAGGGCSPSGYSCDPWSTHLYMASTCNRQGSSLRLVLTHNPDDEGSVNDFMVPPEHQYSQQLTVDFPLTAEVKQFLCVVFTPDSSPPASFDAASVLTQVDRSSNTLLNDGGAGNLADICGPTLSAVYAPEIARNGRPALTDVAMAIPLVPKPTSFPIGTTFQAWLARGILFVDEQAELAPQLTATVVEVQ